MDMPIQDDQRMCRVLDYIDENLDQPLSIKTLATVACMSPWHFARTFKQLMGETPGRYCMARRAGRAIELLQTSTLSLAEIAYCCGFSSQSHMGTVLKAVTSKSPKSLREHAATEPGP